LSRRTAPRPSTPTEYRQSAGHHPDRRDAPAHSFGLEAEADAIVKAVRKVLEQGFRTQDLARTNPEGLTVLGTREMGAKVRETVKDLLA